MAKNKPWSIVREYSRLSQNTGNCLERRPNHKKGRAIVCKARLPVWFYSQLYLILWPTLSFMVNRPISLLKLQLLLFFENIYKYIWELFWRREMREKHALTWKSYFLFTVDQIESSLRACIECFSRWRRQPTVCNAILGEGSLYQSVFKVVFLLVKEKGIIDF